MVAFLIFWFCFVCFLVVFLFLRVKLQLPAEGVFSVFVLSRISFLFLLFLAVSFAYTGSTADVEEICDEEAGEISVVVAVPCGRPRYFSS